MVCRVHSEHRMVRFDSLHRSRYRATKSCQIPIGRVKDHRDPIAEVTSTEAMISNSPPLATQQRDKEDKEDKEVAPNPQTALR